MDDLNNKASAANSPSSKMTSIPGLSFSITASASEDSHEDNISINLHDNTKENEIGDYGHDDWSTYDGPMKQSSGSNDSSSTGCTKRRTLIYTSVVTCLAVLAMTVGISVSSSKQPTVSSVEQAAYDVCPEGIIDRHWPMLELKFDTTPMTRDGDSHSTMSDEDIKNFVKAVQDGYNSIVKTCGEDDPQGYKRWSFTTSFVSQTLEGGIEMVQQEPSTRNGYTYTMEHDFVDTTNLVVQVMLGISCDGCSPDEAFATAYPTSFVPGYAAGGMYNDGEDRRRRLSVNRRQQTADSSNMSSPADNSKEEEATEEDSLNGDESDSIKLLNAANLLTSISNAVQLAVPSLGPVAEATVTIMEQINVEQMSGETDPIITSSLVKTDVS